MASYNDALHSQEILMEGDVAHRPEGKLIIDYLSRLKEIKDKDSDPLWQPVLWTEVSRNETIAWVSTTAELLISEFEKEKKNRGKSRRQPILLWKAAALTAVMCKFEDFWEHFDIELRASLLKKIRQVRIEVLKYVVAIDCAGTFKQPSIQHFL
jgi:hypothetical protein